MKGLLAKKLGMTQLFNADGTTTAVTVLEAGPCRVLGLRTAEKDGYSAARIEEEVVVTDKGCQVITLFPAEELPIANRY